MAIVSEGFDAQAKGPFGVDGPVTEEDYNTVFLTRAFPDLINRVRFCLNHVAYRPGWYFDVHPTPFGDGCWIFVHGPIIDSEDFTHILDVDVRMVVPHFDYDREFYDWLEWRLQRIERHESREFFWVDGKPYNSPHKIPQPPVDYRVRKLAGSWVVFPYAAPGEVKPGVYATTDWASAYRKAWELVIEDDLNKQEQMKNG